MPEVLNKMVCRRCIGEYRYEIADKQLLDADGYRVKARRPWGWDDDDMWSRGCIVCPVRFAGMKCLVPGLWDFRPLRIPKWCPYETEHVVSMGHEGVAP